MVDTRNDQYQVSSAPKNAAPSRRHMLASLNERVASVISRLSEHEIVEALVRQTDADSDLACAIQLITDRGIVLAAMQEVRSDGTETGRGRLFPLDESHAWGRAVRAQQPVILSDIQADLYVRELAAPIPGADVKSVVIMPLIARWSCLGTITPSASRSDAFDSEAVAALATFASDTALLIENARLYEQAQRRLARMRLAHDIFILMHSSLELNDVLRVALRGLEQLTTCSWAALYLLDEGSSELRPVLSTCDAPKDADATIWTVDLTDGSADAISTILRSGQPGVFHPGDVLHHRIGGAPLTSPDVRWTVTLTADGRANGMLMAAWQSER